MRLKRILDGNEKLVVITVHEKLWLYVLDHCNENELNASYLFEILAREYIKNPFTPIFKPDRRILPFKKVPLFYSEFPEINTSLLIHRDIVVNSLKK